MKPEERKEYAKHRLANAYNTYEAAKILAEKGFWNSAVNRLYYSLYSAVNALLVYNEIKTHSHSGLRGQFSLHFVKTKKFDVKYGKLLAELYDWRQKGDYENIFDFDAETVMPLFDPVLELIKRIEQEID